jgi:DNA-binding PadR family transcriptional regulator
MIEHQLLFLGLLKDGPKHGYEIKRLINDELSSFVGLTIKSIYYPLNKMEKLGLIKKDVGRDGKRPEKYIYSLTAKGDKTFHDLILKSFLSIERPYFHIDLSIYFAQYVDKKMVQRQMRGRVLFLKKIKRQLENLQKNLDSSKKHLNIILEHDFDLVSAEIKSIEKLTKKF